LIVLLTLALPVIAQDNAEEQTQTAGRAVAMDIDAKVTAIDLKTREVSLYTSSGVVFTVFAPEALIKLEDLNVGDRLVGSAYAAVEAELRAPTKEELAHPWQVLEDASVSAETANPGVDAARQVRAVVTILAMNPETGDVVVKDSRGKVHFFEDVKPETMSSVAVDQQVVVVFTEALAVSLQRKAAVAQ
jgi:hypothetical protein